MTADVRLWLTGYVWSHITTADLSFWHAHTRKGVRRQAVCVPAQKPAYGPKHTNIWTHKRPFLSPANTHPPTHTVQHALSSGDIQQHCVIVCRSIAVITFADDERPTAPHWENSLLRPADFTGWKWQTGRQILSVGHKHHKKQKNGWNRLAIKQIKPIFSHSISAWININHWSCIMDQ